MRYSSLIVLVVLGAVSCQTRDKAQAEVRSQADTCYFRLMQAEVNLVGEFMRKQDFNAGLKFECREPELEPYPKLFGALDSMQAIHNMVLDNRGEYFVAKDSKLKRIFFYNKKEIALLGADLEQDCSRAKTRFAELETLFDVQRENYDKLCEIYGIVRITHGEYADSLLTRIILWQDSMEAQGRIIGGARQVLRNSGHESLSEAYQTVYAPVSQMEKLHKEFQAQILLVENQHGRYDSSREDEWYYRGPHLVTRYDVDKTEEEVSELADMMSRFRVLHEEYRMLSQELGMR